MCDAGEDLGWPGEPEDDDLGPAAARAVAIKYYRQWRSGQLDPSEPIRVELLLAAEHILNDMRRSAAAALMPQAAVKLSLPVLQAQSGSETEAHEQISTVAGNVDELEIC